MSLGEQMIQSEKLLAPVQDETTNPRLEFRNGQHLFVMTNQEGGVVERFISDAAVREAFSGIPIDSGWLRPEIVKWGNGKLGEWAVAFFAPQVHELDITSESAADAPEQFTLERLQVPLPGLVFFGLGTQYFLWAVKTQKLHPYQEIYRAPLPNVYVDGKVCWGLVKPPRVTARAIFDAWELFIKSTFNNHLANGKSKAHREDVRVMLRQAYTGDYPITDLVRQVEHTGVTLDKAIKEFFQTGEMPA